mmetsp:Transcript_43389/g.52600  ORF Transcript_43389/g.52600 Transcript_43389/m.52600 type:complete len:124 (+) Transcript_43389:383-754(+)
MTKFKRRQRMEGFCSAAAVARLSLPPPPPSSSVDYADAYESERRFGETVAVRKILHTGAMMGRDAVWSHNGALSTPLHKLVLEQQNPPRRQLPPFLAAISHHIHRAGSTATTTTGRPAQDRQR